MYEKYFKQPLEIVRGALYVFGVGVVILTVLYALTGGNRTQGDYRGGYGGDSYLN